MGRKRGARHHTKHHGATSSIHHRKTKVGHGHPITHHRAATGVHGHHGHGVHGNHEIGIHGHHGHVIHGHHGHVIHGHHVKKGLFSSFRQRFRRKPPHRLFPIDESRDEGERASKTQRPSNAFSLMTTKTSCCSLAVMQICFVCMFFSIVAVAIVLVYWFIWRTP